MKARVQKWGNSLALRIPKSFANEAGLGEDSAVDLKILDGKIVIKPMVDEALCLDELLRGVTEENIHREWDTGPAVGKEVW